MRSPRFSDRARSRPVDPHRRLMAAVLRAAFDDVRGFGQCSALAYERQSALAYVTSMDRRWPFSFENLCDALDMNADRVRRALKTS